MSDDLLTVAEADALASQYRPRPRAGVHTWTPRTLGEYRALDLTRPITDTAGLQPFDVTAPRAVCAPHPADVRRYEKRIEARQRRARDKATTKLGIQPRDSKFGVGVLGFVVDMSVWRELHAAAIAYSWSLRGTQA